MDYKYHKIEHEKRISDQTIYIFNIDEMRYYVNSLKLKNIFCPDILCHSVDLSYIFCLLI